MGTMTFRLPPGLPDEAVSELQRACLTGGPDNMPWPANLDLDPSHLRLEKEEADSGYLVAPWLVADTGRVCGSSATLMERAAPYDLLIELARGKVNQVRNQAAEWQSGGLVVPPALLSRLRDATLAFGRSVTAESPAEAHRHAQLALDQAYADAELLVELYRDQVYRIRHQRHPRLDAALGCRLDAAVFDPETGQRFRNAFNRAVLPLSWHTIEAQESTLDWSHADRLLDWAEDNQLDVMAGPLIDFSASQLPGWLWMWERDVPIMANLMCQFVEAAVRRYRSRVRRWQITAASNWANILGLTEEELMGLTFRLGEAARSVDPSLDLVIGLTQPWGEYRSSADRFSPFQFADRLLRSGLSLGGLDLEIVMGVNGRGSYCRDLLDVSRLLDLYALLGVPLSVTLGYPAESGAGPDADPELSVGAGHWRVGHDPESQLDWARNFASLALCKPYVHSVQWCHFSDNLPHLFPNCGLLDRRAQPRPALDALQSLRQTHLT